MKAKTELTRDDKSALDCFLVSNNYGYNTQKIIDTIEKAVLTGIETNKVRKDFVLAKEHLEKAREIFEKYEELLRQNEWSFNE